MKNNQETACDTESSPQQLRRLQRQHHSVGMALVGTMMSLMLVMTLVLIGIVSSTGGVRKASLGALSAADGSIALTGRRTDYYGAMNNAETGVRMTVQWMSEQATLPTSTNTTPFYPDIQKAGWFDSPSSNPPVNSTWDDTNKYRFVPWDNRTGSANGYRVKVYPYTSNTYDTQKKFIIESVGEYNGRTQIVRAAVRQESFANYALFVDNVPDYFLVSGNNAFGGPVHLNASDAAATGKTVNIIWKDGSADPTKDQIFRYKQKNAFTTSADSINWNYNSPTNPRDPVGTTSLNHVVADGGSVQTGMAEIPLPTSSTVQADAAFGPTKTAPANSAYYNNIPLMGTLGNVGVALPSSGGIVIKGDVQDMVFSVDPNDSTKQIIQIYQTQSISVNGVNTAFRLRSTVTMDRTGAAGTTTIATAYTLRTNNSNWVPVLNLNQPAANTVPNGVVYAVNGNVNGVRGVIADNVTDQDGKNIVQRNSLTVATANNKTLQIGGSITYKTLVTDPNDPYEPVGSGDKFKSGLLGIVANKVQISQFSQNPEGASGRTNATTKGGANELRDMKVHATVFAYDTFEAQNFNTRSVGLIDLLGGYIAKNGGTFGQISPTTGLLTSGFSKSNNYDDRVLDSPPPAFPSTANSYKVISFKRVTQTLDTRYDID